MNNEYLRIKNKKLENGLSKEFKDEDLNKLISTFPYELTSDQKKVLNEILGDLKSKRRMNRLLQGDVGSGKTVISILALYATVLSGFQGALMVPTEILANQHYNQIKKMFPDINIVLLTGKTKNKKTIYIIKKV